MIFIQYSKRVTIKFVISISILMFTVGTVVIGLEFLLRSSLTDPSYKPSKILSKMGNSTSVNGESITVSKETLDKLNIEGSWLQILNEEGREIYSFHKPASIQNSYAPGELVSYRKAGSISGYRIYTWFKVIGSKKLTWVYGTVYHENIMDSFRTWVAITVLCITLLLIIALMFGIQMGRPVLYILKWVEGISKGIYQEPSDDSGRSAFRSISSNQLRREYKVHEELIMAVQSLSSSLQENENRRKQLDNSREEWIAGVSHDMKTPLSSVKGYADILASGKYSFDEKETRHYAGIIGEKAAYMENLIEDLNLTFAISNNALPINLEKENLVELVRRSVIDLINSGISDHVNIDFLNDEEDKILYPVDKMWFKRAIDNLLWNAVHHNDSSVKITVNISCEPGEYDFAPVNIRLSDNGKGMTKEQKERIFERYYRGTSTSAVQVKGSGLGTAIAKQLIQANGGNITANSSVGHGTEFMIHLPGIS